MQSALLTLCLCGVGRAMDADAARAEAQQGVVSVRAELATLNANQTTH